jgi:AcrR family transcriptional regulator
VGIAEITEAADVGTGTFYNYFSSRDQLLATVAEESMEEVGTALDRDISTLDDPAEVFAGSLRHLIKRSLTDRVWGGFLVQMGAAHPALLRILGPRARRDLLRGVESGRFTIPDLDLVTTCTFGSLTATVQLALTSPDRRDWDRLYAGSMLRMIGLSPVDADEVVSRPLPAADLPGPGEGSPSRADGR